MNSLISDKLAHQAPPDDAQLWGRPPLGALADVVEWREWFTLLARRSLARREAGEAGTAVAEKAQRGDTRAPPDDLAYWRWGEIYPRHRRGSLV